MSALEHYSSRIVKHYSNREVEQRSNIVSGYTNDGASMTFGERLRAVRTRLGLTQEQFGFALGITNSAVSAWENGRDVPSFHILPRLREVSRRSLDELICGSPGERLVIGVDPGLAVADNPAAMVFPPCNTVRDRNEDALLSRFRELSPAKRNAVLELLKPGR